MAWRLKNKEPEVAEEESKDDEEELKEKLKLIEEKKKQIVPEKEAFSKQELIDAIQGNLARVSRLIELLRSN